MIIVEEAFATIRVWSFKKINIDRSMYILFQRSSVMNSYISDHNKGRGRLRLEIGPPLKVLGDHLLPSIPTRWFRKTTNRTSLGGQYPTKSLIFQPTIWVRHTYPEPYACRRGMHAHSENLSDRCNFSRSTTLQAVPPLPEVALTVMWSENHRKSKILPVVDLFRDF